MKILHVIAETDPERGGVSQAVRTIISGLEEEGVRNEVVSLDPPDAPFLVRDPFPVHALGPRNGRWGYNAKLVPWLVDNLPTYDAVVMHGLWLYPSYALYKAIRRCKSNTSNRQLPKVFVMPHGMLDPWFQRASSRKIKALRNWLYWQLLERHIIAEADGLLFTCESELQLAREPFQPYRPKREVVVGLGVDEPPVYTPAMQQAFRAKCPEVQDSPYILFISRIHEKKGVDLLIEAYSQKVRTYLKAGSAVLVDNESSADNNPTHSVPKLVIAGPGLDTPYGNKVQQLVQQTPGLANFVCFPGMLTGDAKWGAFYGCEAFVLPSHQENFGIAVVEALACSKPVLISNQVNIWREIIAEQAGLVGDDTPEGTRKLMMDWETMPQLEKQEIGQRARKAYLAHFAIKSATEQMIAALS